MLKKENRLWGRGVMGEVFDKGKMVQSPLFGMLYIEKPEDKDRFGVVVSRKISKKAVERNRIKRKIYFEVGRIINQNKLDIWGIFLIKKTMLEVSDKEIGEEIKRALKLAGK